VARFDNGDVVPVTNLAAAGVAFVVDPANVASVSAQGAVSALEAGPATINASLQANGVTRSDSVALQVSAVTPDPDPTPDPTPDPSPTPPSGGGGGGGTPSRTTYTATIQAPTATVDEGTSLPNGFVVSLSPAAPAAGVTVSYVVSGTAQSGVDFTALSGTVTMATGASSANIALNTIATPDYQPPRTVVVSLIESDKYAVGAAGSATVTINDLNPAPTPPAAGEVVRRRDGVIYNGTTALQDAQNAADTVDGDIFDVGSGTYDGLDVKKNLTFYGPNAGVPGDGTRAAEAVITAPGIWFRTDRADKAYAFVMDGFRLPPNTANRRVRVDALGATHTVQLTVRNCLFNDAGGAVYIFLGGPSIFDVQIQGNAFQDIGEKGSAVSAHLTHTTPSAHKLVLSNNTVSGDVTTDSRGFQFINTANVLVAENTFRNLGAHGMHIAAALVGATSGEHTVLNNLFDNVSQVTTADDDGPGAIILWDAPALAGPITINGNTITGAATKAGIVVREDGGGNFTANNFKFNYNNLIPGAGPGFINPGPNPTGTIDLKYNWWGTPTPTVGTQIEGTANGLDFSNPLTGPIN
jgi:hypothetical protein